MHQRWIVIILEKLVHFSIIGTYNATSFRCTASPMPKFDQSKQQLWHNHGVTLTELLLVVMILSIVAAIAIPSVAPSSGFALDRAVAQVTYALEFASREAQRTGKVTVASFNTVDRTIEVYQPIYNPTLSGRIPVKHPLEKRNFVVRLDEKQLNGDSITLNALFAFEDSSTDSEIAFDSLGHAGKHISATEVIKLVDLPYVWRGVWQSAGMSYDKNDNVVYGNLEYIALTNHNSGTNFQSEIVAGLWTKRTSPAQIRLSSKSTYDIYIAPNTGTLRVYKQ